MKYKNELAPKDGRERVRRSLIVYRDSMDKFVYISKHSSVAIYELMEQIMQQVINEWENQHGKIKLLNEKTTDTSIEININSAIKNAKPALKRGSHNKINNNKGIESNIE